MSRKCLLFTAVVVFTFANISLAAETINAYSKKTPFVPSEVIVKFRATPASVPVLDRSYINASTASGRARVKKLSRSHNSGMSVSSNSEDKIDEPGLYRLDLQGREDIYSVIDELKKNPDVEYAEPNYIFQTDVVPNDPQYSMQWASEKIGAPAAWDVLRGDPDVVIAVIDTGVDYRHPDLAPNIWSNTREVAGNGIDDDHNGYIDDIKGWDFVDVPSQWVAKGEDPGPPDNDPMDFLGHGTHVSGIAAGLPNNGIGIAGIAWTCRIMPLRAGYQYLDGSGYLELADIAQAIRYAADNGASVINMSFGCLSNSASLQDAVNYAHGKGCILVAAAGNVDSYMAGEEFYPAACDNVIGVAALDSEDRLAIWDIQVFSNFGTFVDLSAPGTSILSTLPNRSYGYNSGTSMATPFVSGVAALVRSKNKSWGPDKVEERMKATSDDVYKINSQSFLAGKLGAGRVNAKRAMGNLSMAIKYPRPNSVLSGSVVVKGDANMDYFSGYRLEFANASSPEAWGAIIDNSALPIENGVLAIWNVYDPNGKFLLRLTVNNSSGEAYQCVSKVNFGLDGEVKLSGKPKCGPSPFDPGRDNFLFYYDLLSAADVDIYVYDITGTMIWKKQLPYDPASSGSGGSAGENRVYWDGTDGFGVALGNGAYIYMIVANDSGQRKIIGRGKFAVVRS